MISIEYRPAASRDALVVEWDEERRFWPFLVAGRVRVDGTRVERAWRGRTLREAVGKAAASGCIALRHADLDAVCAAAASALEAAR
ncbi:MAG TPA: hypothetical protein VFA82_05335 [Gaiellaceae bacterium]|nr:hypothetical protein [Gaiellaceae bacterium]